MIHHRGWRPADAFPIELSELLPHKLKRRRLDKQPVARIREDKPVRLPHRQRYQAMLKPLSGRRVNARLREFRRNSPGCLRRQVSSRHRQNDAPIPVGWRARRRDPREIVPFSVASQAEDNYLDSFESNGSSLP